MNKSIDIWVTCDGKWLKTGGMTAGERALVGEAVQVYWATVCPDVPSLSEVPGMEWTFFANWWHQEFVKRGFDFKVKDPTGRTPPG